jgi:hypothetical protein
VPTTPCGVPAGSRQSGLAARGETELLPTELDLLAPEPAADSWAGAGGTGQERRADALQLLAIYSQLIKVLQRRIDLTIKDALDVGSDYGEIVPMAERYPRPAGASN